MSSIVVLLSGGQDSTTVLYWAKANFDVVKAISIDYGQLHDIELQASKKIAQRANVEFTLIDAKFVKQLSKNALIDDTIEITTNKETGLPTSFVPGRNLLFITIAASWAYDKGIRDIALGVSQVDYSGYPDCRDEFIRAAQKTISLAMDVDFKIHTPLVFMSKADEIRLIDRLGYLDELAFTHTCYKGDYPPCGECPACRLRAEAFKEVGIDDPLIKRAKKDEKVY